MMTQQQTDILAMIKTDSPSYTIIYCYTIDDKEHVGLVKIGQTELRLNGLQKFTVEIATQAALKRIKEQSGATAVKTKLEWLVPVVFDPQKPLKDHDIHAALKREGIQNVKFPHSNAREWFRITPARARQITEYRIQEKTLTLPSGKEAIVFRKEQKRFIKNTIEAYLKGDEKRLWFAKMRFGKTLTAYKFIQNTMDTDKPAKNVLIVTNRPEVVRGWEEDFSTIFQDGDRDFLKAKNNAIELEENPRPNVVFVSMQDIKGKDTKSKVQSFKQKNKGIFDTHWDVVTIDEAHEGQDTELATAMHSELKRTFTLYLSGTAFKFLEGDAFNSNQIDEWDYVEEQREKANWDYNLGPNPYEGLPKMVMSALDIRQSVKNKYVNEADSFNDASFEFNKFFSVNSENKGFENIDDIDLFLNSLTKDDAMPYSPYHQMNTNHSLWVLPSVKACELLKDVLEKHPFFKNYTILNVSGMESNESKKPLAEWNQAVYGNSNGLKYAEKNPLLGKTITLTVGRLTTGVTMPHLSAVLMLKNTTSAEFYLQTIFRGQSPASWEDNIKRQCFVWDFAPDRVLQVFGKIAGVTSKAGEKSSIESKEYLRELLNYFPILAYTGGKDLIPLDISSFTIELKKAIGARVVANQFDSNFLFTRNLERLEPDVRETIQTIHIANGANTHSTRERPDNKIKIGPGNGFDVFTFSEIEEKIKKTSPAKTAEEIQQLEALKAELKERNTILAVLKTVAVRIPYLLLALCKDMRFTKYLGTLNTFSIGYFVDAVDDESWKEFFGSITKEAFLKLEPVFDEDVLLVSINAWLSELDRTFAQETALTALEYANEIGKLFTKIKNPNKETVLTPFSVVDAVYTNARLNKEDNTSWGHKARKNDTFFDLNSKTGLFPLYALAGLLHAQPGLPIHKTKEEIITNQIFVNTRTEAAAWVVETVLGLEPTYVEKVNPKTKETITIRTTHPNITVIDVVKLLKAVEVWNQLPMKKQTVTYKKIDDPHLFVGRILMVANKGFLQNRKINFLHFFEEELHSTLNSILDKIINEADSSAVEELVNIMDSKEAILREQDFKFDYVISNPPYQDAFSGAASRGEPIYHNFIEIGRLIGTTSVMITPGRFLFEAGLTPSAWNKKMLTDPAVKVLYYTPRSQEMFPSADIKGGVAVTEIVENRDDAGLGGYFISNPFLSELLKRVQAQEPESIQNIVFDSRTTKLTDFALNDYPELRSASSPGQERILGTNIFKTVSILFHDEEETNDIKILGLGDKQKRLYKFLNKKYLTEGRNLNNWKVFLPKANGSGAIGEVLSAPLTGSPMTACTQTFLSIGKFNTQYEAESCLKYIKTKFARAMLATLKIAQDNAVRTWVNVPMQDFTKDSDIDWDCNIDEIDSQLYKKYGFTQNDIEWVEEKITPMS